MLGKNIQTLLQDDKTMRAWEQTRLGLEQNKENKIAVLSVQSLDNKKIILSPKELGTYAQLHPGVQKSGDGHTGFAMAMALNAPFGVMRSKANQDALDEVLKQYIGDNSLIVVTGHGAAGEELIEGNYGYVTSFINQTIKRGPDDVVRSTMDAGLQSGNHISILLCICFGALDTLESTSFAHKLAQEYASQGISSTIIASDSPFYRFGANAITDETITFDERYGMAAKNVHVFHTEFDDSDSNPLLTIFKANDTVQLTRNGISFLNSNQHVELLIQKQPVEQPIHCLSIKEIWKSWGEVLHAQHNAENAERIRNYNLKQNGSGRPLALLDFSKLDKKNDSGQPGLNSNKANSSPKQSLSNNTQSAEKSQTQANKAVLQNEQIARMKFFLPPIIMRNNNNKNNSDKSGLSVNNTNSSS